MRDTREPWRKNACPECDKTMWSSVSEPNSLNDQHVRCLFCGTSYSTAWLEYLHDLKDKDDYIIRLRTGLKREKITQRELARMAGCSVSNINAQLNGRAPLAFYVWKAARIYVLFGELPA